MKLRRKGEHMLVSSRVGCGFGHSEIGVECSAPLLAPWSVGEQEHAVLLFFSHGMNERNRLIILDALRLAYLVQNMKQTSAHNEKDSTTKPGRRSYSSACKKAQHAYCGTCRTVENELLPRSNNVKLRLPKPSTRCIGEAVLRQVASSK